MTPKQFSKFLKRDGGCVHCGETETVSPHHRSNRGMGGSKERDKPGNIIVLCSWLNNALESETKWASKARDYGWKLRSWEDPLDTWYYHFPAGEWRLNDNQFGFIVRKL